MTKSPNTETYQVKDNTNHQTAARAHSDLLAIAQIIDANLEAVAAWARVRIDLHGRVEGHVFDLDLIVDVEAFVRHFVVLSSREREIRVVSFVEGNSKSQEHRFGGEQKMAGRSCDYEIVYPNVF